jgi:hypothetical protein
MAAANAAASSSATAAATTSPPARGGWAATISCSCSGCGISWAILPAVNRTVSPIANRALTTAGLVEAAAIGVKARQAAQEGPMIA